MFQDMKFIIKSFFKLVEIDKKNFALLIFTSTLGHLSSLIFPYLASLIIDVVIAKNYDQAYMLAFVMGISYICYSLCWHWNYTIYANGFKKYYKNLQSKMINTVGNYDQEFTKRISYGKIISTTNRDVIDLAAFSDKVVELFTYAVKLIILYIIFLYINISIGITVIAITFISILFLDYANKKRRNYLRGQRKYMDKIMDIFSQVILGLKEIKAFNLLPKLNHNSDVVKKKFDYEYSMKRKYCSVCDNGLPAITNLYKVVLYMFLST